MSKLKNKLFAIFCVLGILFSSLTLQAQSKKELENKKKQLQKEIRLTNKLLKETKKNKDLSVDELLKLKSKINARSSLISTMNSEIKLINEDIGTIEENIILLEVEIKRLKNEYSKIIYYAYKHRNTYDNIMFVFASKNVNQAYKRLKYIQQYAEYRKSQAQAIVDSQVELKQKIEKLQQVKQENSALISLQEQEKQQLSLEKSEQENVVKKLQGQEQELKDKLRKKEAAKRKLQKAIQRIIEEEIRKAREAAKKSGTTSKGFPMTPEAKKLSNSFAANKGKLPWPVIEGVITARFGKHPHPVLSGITINNNGIDISTTKGANARAIFSGVVSSVAIIPGEGKVVMVRHGEYLSVYSYMSEVFVKKGDKISIKQDLGKLISESGKSKTLVHLEIWKGMTKLNPEYWIFRK
jgi:septal ring factor EnvC (AmiA/AmiB activator)